MITDDNVLDKLLSQPIIPQGDQASLLARYKTSILNAKINSSASFHSSSGFDSYDKSSKKTDVALWRSVILQAVLDSNSQAKRKETQNARKDAIEWLNIANEDFLYVCEMAELSPHYVLRRAKFAASNVSVWKKSSRDLKIDKNNQVNPDSFIGQYSGLYS